MPSLTVTLEPRLLATGRKRVTWKVGQSTGESVEGDKPAMLKLLRATIKARLAEGFDVTAKVYAASGALTEHADYHPDGSAKYHHVPPPEGEHGFGARCRSLVETEEGKAARRRATAPEVRARTMPQRIVAAMLAGDRSGISFEEAADTFVSVLNARSLSALVRAVETAPDKATNPFGKDQWYRVVRGVLAKRGLVVVADTGRATRAPKAKAPKPPRAPKAPKPPRAPKPPKLRVVTEPPAEAPVAPGPAPDPALVASLGIAPKAKAPRKPKAEPKAPKKPRAPKAPTPEAAPAMGEDERMEAMFGKLIELELAKPA